MEKFHYKKKKTLLKNIVIVVNLYKRRTWAAAGINILYEMYNTGQAPCQ